MRRIIRSKDEIENIYRTYANIIYRVCFAYMKNEADAEEMVSETFVQLIKKGPEFDNKEHEKAWLIRVATNLCINALKHWNRRCVDIDCIYDVSTHDIVLDETMEVILGLPEKYKTVIYLYYYEGYNCEEIALMLHKSSSTVRNHLAEGRRILKERLGDIN